MNHDIVVAAEQRDGIVQKISFELIHGAARWPDRPAAG